MWIGAKGARSSTNGNGAGSPDQARAAVRRLRSGAPAHTFTAEERRRGAERTNAIKRERAAANRKAQVSEEAIDTIYLLTADKLVLQQALNRLSEELNCSECRHALVACELVFKYLLPKARPGEQRGVGLAMLTLANRIRELGLDSDVEREVVKLLRPHRRDDEKLVDP